MQAGCAPLHSAHSLHTSSAPSSSSSAAAAGAPGYAAVTHATTILSVRKGGEVVVMGDGQATQEAFIVKANVLKVRRAHLHCVRTRKQPACLHQQLAQHALLSASRFFHVFVPNPNLATQVRRVGSSVTGGFALCPA